jgi:hypothetical protein
VYARALGQRSVFTPQIIVNGKHSLVGSQEADVRQALTAAGRAALPVQANLSQEANGSFKLVLSGPAAAAEVWEVRYVRHAVTRIGAGENGGRTLETFNNVTQLRRIASYQPGELTLQPLKRPDDGLAILVQKPGAGEILGIAAY